MAKRFWFRFGRKARRGGRGQLGLSLLCGLILAILLIHWFDAALRPQLVALSETQLRNYLTQAANLSVTQATGQEFAYDDMVNLQTETGGIATLTTDSKRLNCLRTVILDDVITQVEALDNHLLSVPIGALTGIDLLSALGPRLPIQVISVTSAEGFFQNDFFSAGINQTLHRITLDIRLTAKLLLPGGIAEVLVSTPVCVAETIIVGQVPQTYVGLSK